MRVRYNGFFQVDAAKMPDMFRIWDPGQERDMPDELARQLMTNKKFSEVRPAPQKPPAPSLPEQADPPVVKEKKKP